MELQLQHLSKRYGTKKAVDNININLVPEHFDDEKRQIIIARIEGNGY